MSKWTPAPWSYDPDENEIHADEWSGSDGDPAHVAEMLGPRDRANAERIVACVNACEGIENPSVVPELLALVRQISKRFSLAKFSYAADHDALPDPGTSIAEQWEIACALIARAEGRK